MICYIIPVEWILIYVQVIRLSVKKTVVYSGTELRFGDCDTLIMKNLSPDYIFRSKSLCPLELNILSSLITFWACIAS